MCCNFLVSSRVIMVEVVNECAIESQEGEMAKCQCGELSVREKLAFIKW